jgi:hypothetical protein
MARAYLALYEASGDDRFLRGAQRTFAWMQAHLEDGERGGFFAHTEDPQAVGVFKTRRRPLELNGLAARVALELSRRTGEPSYRRAAERAVTAIADPDLVERHGRKVGAYALALERLTAPYVLISVVGPSDHAGTEALHQAALKLHEPLALVERSQPGESRYPYPGAPAAYLCNAEACSTPVKDANRLAAAVRQFLSIGASSDPSRERPTERNR